MLSRNRWCPVAAVLGVVLVLASPVAAQEGNTDQAPRLLGGHLYMPSTLVPDPFIATSLQNITGFGTAVDLKVPVFNLQGEKVDELTGNLGFLVLEFDYQYAFNHRFSARAGIVGNGRVGTSAQSVLAEGISALGGYSLGGSAMIVRKTNWEMTGTLDLRGNTLYQVSPLSFARSVVRQFQQDSTASLQEAADSVVTSGSNLRVVGGLRGVYTPVDWLGLTAFLESGLGEKFTPGASNTSVLNGGLAADVDFNALGWSPFGILLSYRYESLSERGSDRDGSSRSYGLGVFYTGRRYFSIGLDLVGSQIKQEFSDTKVKVGIGRIAMRYDFK
jgi:hypothetical protein